MAASLPAHGAGPESLLQTGCEGDRIPKATELLVLSLRQVYGSGEKTKNRKWKPKIGVNV